MTETSRAMPENRPRLRASCDSCAVAKVKCDRKQPSCTRCVLSKFSCAYSPSRRCGKQPCSKKAVRTRSPQELRPKPGSFPSTTVTQTTLSPLPMPPTESPSSSSLDPSSSSDLTSPSSNTTPPNYLDLDMLNMFGDHVDTTLQGFDLSNNGLDLFSHWTWTGHPNVADFVDPRVEAVYTNSTSDTVASNENTTEGTAADSKYAIHDCEGPAITALHNLHFCKMVHTDEPNAPTETTLENVSALMPSLDKVLSFNRTALEAVRKGFDCKCSYQSHMAALYTSILSKVLFWYQLSASPSYHLLPPSEDPLRREIVAGCDGGTQIRDRMVGPAQISMGAFDLDPADQLALVRTVLLREVTKVDGLLQSMRELAGWRNGKYYGKWYELACSDLEVELQDTMEAINTLGRKEENAGQN